MFPDYLDGAKVLEYTDPGDFGIIVDYDGDSLPLAREVRYLAICAYTGDAARYLFSCDSDYAVIGDACCDTTAECKDIHPHAVWHPKNDPYFRNAAQRKSQGSTCYLEFQRGRFQGKHWLERSLYLHDNAFEQLGLHKVFLRVFADNLRAIKSYENAGFVKEACFKDDVKIDGKYYDMVFMAIINEKDD